MFDSRIFGIDDDVFSGLEYLERIDIQHCPTFQILPLRPVKNSLERIRIYWTPLERLPEEYFYGGFVVEQIQFERNNLSNLPLLAW